MNSFAETALLICFQLLVVHWFQFTETVDIITSDPPPGTYTSYQLGPVCKSYDGVIHTPKNFQQVLNLVQLAQKLNVPLKAFGQRHSLSDIICTEGIAVDMSFIKGLKLNPDNTVTASAGVTVLEIGKFLHSKNRALLITPAYGGITIGGALGTQSHGSSLKHESTLAAQTVAVKIIDGTGTIRMITLPYEMRAYRNHLGLLGVILEATIKTVPGFKLHVRNYETSDVILENGLWESIARASDSFFMYWFPLSRTVVISDGRFVGIETPGDAWSNDHVPPTSDLSTGFSVTGVEVLQEMNSFAGLFAFEKYMMKTLTVDVPYFVPIYTQDGRNVMNPAVGYAHMMLAANCFKDCSWYHHPFNLSMIDNEIAIDIKHIVDFVRTTRDILAKSPAAFPVQGILMRFSMASNTFMSNSNGRDSVHLEWYPIKRRNQFDKPIHGMAAYQTMMESLAFLYGGRSHWGKSGLHYHSREILQRNIDPKNMQAFLEIRQLADPNNLFMNNFGRRLLNISDTLDMDPRTKHCAILDNCICKSHSDCAIGQFCGTILGYPKFNVCRNFV